MRLAIIRQRYKPQGRAERFLEAALEALLERNVAITLYTREWPQTKLQLIEPHICDPFYLGPLWRDWGFARAVTPRRRDRARQPRAVARSRADLRRLPARRRHPRDVARGAAARRVGRRCAGAWRCRRGTATRSRWSASSSRARGCARCCATRRWCATTSRRASACPTSGCRCSTTPSTRTSSRRRCARIASASARKYRIAEDAVAVPARRLRLPAQGRAGGHRGARRSCPSTRISSSSATTAGSTRTSGWRTTTACASASRSPASRPTSSPYYGAADAFVLPAIYDSFPDAAMEALACGLPVDHQHALRRRRARHRERRGIRLRCRATSPRSPRTCARCWTPRVRERLGANARNAVLPLSPAAMTLKLVLLYKELLEASVAHKAARAALPRARAPGRRPRRRRRRCTANSASTRKRCRTATSAPPAVAARRRRADAPRDRPPEVHAVRRRGALRRARARGAGRARRRADAGDPALAARRRSRA